MKSCTHWKSEHTSETCDPRLVTVCSGGSRISKKKGGGGALMIFFLQNNDFGAELYIKKS